MSVRSKSKLKSRRSKSRSKKNTITSKTIPLLKQELNVPKPFYNIHSQSISLTRTPRGLVEVESLYNDENGKRNASFEIVSDINSKKTSLAGKLEKNKKTFTVTDSQNKIQHYNKDEIMTMIQKLKKKLLDDK